MQSLSCGKMIDRYLSCTNDSFPPSVQSANLFMYFDFCLNSIPSMYVYTAYNLIHVMLLLPLSTLVLSWGCQQWIQQRSPASVMSHFDYYTYNMAAMELIGILGAVLHIFSTFLHHMEMMSWGIFIFAFCWGAQMLLPVMICLDRYQAVVFPITYIKLRQAGGLRIRNISTALIWLLGLSGVLLIVPTIKYPQLTIFPACLAILCVITVSICSVSVLYVLIRPPPGAGGVDRVHLKRKAFKTIVIIMGVLLFRFAGNLACYVMSSSLRSDDSAQCVIRSSQTYFNLPSALVLPLLFLQRKGKLPGCKHRTESG
ncbi:hypothetical protein AMECASPLE_030540 [Ameca splendens]|uniref:G-protein coupled receptors family 1 profile domain-containing protein n=1 Tax=Ameca splendens TaxID=208324 RepID=A0ABV0YT27_9TELE